MSGSIHTVLGPNSLHCPLFNGFLDSSDSLLGVASKLRPPDAYLLVALGIGLQAQESDHGGRFWPARLALAIVCISV